MEAEGFYQCGEDALVRACRGMCMLLREPPGGGPPNVLQAGQNTLWVSGTPFSDDGERPWSTNLCAA